MNELNVKQIKRFTSKPNKANFSSNELECHYKTFVSPVETSWRFIIRKRTIEVETVPGNREKITKHVLSIKFVCDTHTYFE